MRAWLCVLTCVVACAVAGCNRGAGASSATAALPAEYQKIVDFIPGNMPGPWTEAQAAVISDRLHAMKGSQIVVKQPLDAAPQRMNDGTWMMTPRTFRTKVNGGAVDGMVMFSFDDANPEHFARFKEGQTVGLSGIVRDVHVSHLPSGNIAIDVSVNDSAVQK